MDVPHTMSEDLEKSLLTKEKVEPEVVAALKSAMENSKINGYAQSYAYGFDQAYREHGLYGVKVQVLYLMNNMQRWTGDEARHAKAILKKW